MRIPTVEQLEKRRTIIEADLVSKLEARDYHGVCDAAMDLREIEAMLKVLVLAEAPRLIPNPLYEAQI